MQTCRHFRNRVPQEYADELRDADPEPCPVCDALPHRSQPVIAPLPSRRVYPVASFSVARDTAEVGWQVGILAFFHRRRA